MTTAGMATLPFLKLLWCNDGDLREVRIPKHNQYGHTASGYFSTPESASAAIERWDGRANIFITLNPVNPALRARSNERIQMKADSTTADTDVVRREWLFIDIDPVRPSGISSSDEELTDAVTTLGEVVGWLRDAGWPEPIRAMSGNGAYALFRVDLPCDEQSDSLIRAVLESLATKFDNGKVKVDSTVSNRARIVGVIGTLKVKGDDLPERPHRRSELLTVPEKLEPVSVEQLQDFAAPLTTTLSPLHADTVPSPSSSLEDALQVAGFEYRVQPPDSKGFTWYHVRICPWHEDGEAFGCGVGQKLPNGPFAGHCFHNRGIGKTWTDWKKALSLPIGGPKTELFKLTDLGNSDRLAARYSNSLRYSAATGWLGWDGRRWQRNQPFAERCAKTTARSILDELKRVDDPLEREQLLKHATRSEAAPRISAMLQLAQSDPQLELDPETLDANPWSLNLLNGTLDLRSGELLKHDPADRITRLAQVTYDPEALCPLWEQFIATITKGDHDLQHYLQKVVGYSLTGHTWEHVLFILYGTGQNGKSTFLETLRVVFGDYSLNVSGETLARTRRAAGGPAEDLARMAGVRFITAAETEEGMFLAEALVKRMTGGDRITARLPYARESLEFHPYGKIFLATNHRPQIRGTDDGIWRRIRLVPFTVTIRDAQRDPRLGEKLRAEASGILNWAIAGLRAYLDDKDLLAPTRVATATRDYRADMDSLLRFLNTRCVRGPEFAERASIFYGEYATWCKAEGDVIASQKAVCTRLYNELGFTKHERNDGNYIVGLCLRNDVGATSPDSEVEDVEDVEGDPTSSDLSIYIRKEPQPSSTSSTSSTWDDAEAEWEDWPEPDHGPRCRVCGLTLSVVAVADVCGRCQTQMREASRA